MRAGVSVVFVASQVARSSRRLVVTAVTTRRPAASRLLQRCTGDSAPGAGPRDGSGLLLRLAQGLLCGFLLGRDLLQNLVVRSHVIAQAYRLDHVGGAGGDPDPARSPFSCLPVRLAHRACPPDSFPLSERGRLAFALTTG